MRKIQNITNTHDKTKMKFFYFLFSIFLFPQISRAATLNSLLTDFGAVLNNAIKIVFGLALLFFFYGVALYVSRAGDQKKASEGKSIMIYGVIALFVMVAISGILIFVEDNLDIHPKNIDNVSSGLIPANN